MSSPTPIVDGTTARPRPARLAKKTESEQPETYHGLPVLTLHVGDPIPTPPSPVFYAMRITPDLARYLLTFNHPNNRKRRERKITGYAADMTDGYWRLTHEALAFSVSAVLQDGQNRLMAVTVYGEPVWFLVTFGWPDETIYVVGRGSPRNNTDALHIDAMPSATTVSAAVTKAWQYSKTVGTRRRWSGMSTPSSEWTRSLITKHPEEWLEITRAGIRAYNRLDKAWGAAIWAAGYYIVWGASTRELVEAFYEEVIEGTGSPRSATRTLADWARRRPASRTSSGDEREPIELIVRAFNAWRAGRSLTMVRQPNFELSRVKPWLR